MIPGSAPVAWVDVMPQGLAAEAFRAPAALAFGKVFRFEQRWYLSMGKAREGGRVLDRWVVWAAEMRSAKDFVTARPPRWIGEQLRLPRVINLLHFRGRGRPELPPVPEGAIWIGAPRTLANSFDSAEHGGRAASLALYRRWLWQEIQRRNERVLRALSEIEEGSTLSCVCKPAPCHGDVVALAWHWCKEEGLLVPKSRLKDEDARLLCAEGQQSKKEVA